MNPWRILLSFLALLGLALSSCSPSVPSPVVPAAEPPSGQTAASNLGRNLSPAVPAGDSAQLVADNTAFAFDFYAAVRGDDGNLICSPYSLSLALAMTYAGARRETERQMAATLHFSLPQERLHPAFNALDLELANRPAQAADVDPQNRFELSLVNALWGQQGLGFQPDFLDTLALNYGAGMRLVDYAADPEAARQAINRWTSQETRQRIEELLPRGILDYDTRLVLVNVIFFQAGWLFPFDETLTSQASFTRLDGSQVQVPRMAMRETPTLAYASGDGWQAVSLPYAGRMAEMVVIVPDPGRFTDFEAGLNAGRYAQILAGLQPRAVRVEMPAFEFSRDFMLRETLRQMGMDEPFTPGLADFSGMTTEEALFISQVVHKAFISVDEAGTEAAAATAVVMARESAVLSDAEVVLTIDRPFFFIIRDAPTGTILFLGRVLDPTAGD
ncbi:MAG: serpin family protein [Anaerolineales bacterium]